MSQIKHVCINQGIPLKEATLSVVYGYLKAEGKTEAPKKSLIMKGDITKFLRFETNGLKELQLKVALVVGFFCALRNSELYDLRRGDIVEDSTFECFNVCIRHSKTDEAGCGFTASIPFSISDISIVSIVRDYLSTLDSFILQSQLSPTDQPLFTAIPLCCLELELTLWQRWPPALLVNSGWKTLLRILGTAFADLRQPTWQRMEQVTNK